MPWKTLVILTAAALIVLATTSPQAYAVNPFKRGGFALERSDLALLASAAEKLYLVDGVEVGTVEKWSNPETGNRGIVRLIKKHEYKGLPCRKLQHDIKLKLVKNPHRFIIDRCRTAEGEWKLLFQ